MNVNNNNYNISTTGGLGATGQTGDVGQLDGMTLTQGATAPKKGFKAQVKEFFREIGQFFKSLTQRKATVVNPRLPGPARKAMAAPCWERAQGDGFQQGQILQAHVFGQWGSLLCEAGGFHGGDQRRVPDWGHP
ncbi:hypothetical protein [Verrucomicrobium spinosum]|uniref:hypothetical protein n=1 Tax=Verrucomicrobium spinosum TaxID=2736 RepID=UPI001C4595B0|nr:hypothetical protein [Verrucomicrobium spinosum]